MKVFIYFNLHQKCLSVKSLEGEHKGKVIAHVHSAQLAGVEFKVSEAGRQRVITEQKKNVHAGIIGELWNADIKRFRFELNQEDRESISWFDPMAHDHHRLTDVTYNPYKYKTFVHKLDDSQPILTSKFVSIKGKEIRAR